jgi:hypothetical protein
MLSSSAKADDPVRRGLRVDHGAAEYWIARSSRAMTAVDGRRDRTDRNPSGEDSLIARYFRPLATDPGAFNLDDDAAILKAVGRRHRGDDRRHRRGRAFPARRSARHIARKALRVNLSDLAAKGATPAGFVLTLALRAPTMPG